MAEAGSRAAMFEKWWSFGSTIIAPATLLSTLMFYFGYVSSRAEFRYFGLDVDTLGLSTQDFVSRSPQTLLVPLLAISLGGASLLLLHLAVRRHPPPVPVIRGFLIASLACVLLGLGATWFLPAFEAITRQTLGIVVSKELIAGNGFVLTAGSAQAGSVSTAAIGLLLVALGAVPLLLWYFLGRTSVKSTGPAWDCGLPGLTAENEYTATAFSKPLRMIFAALFRPRREIQADFKVSPYYPTAIRFETEIEPTFETKVYAPMNRRILWVASRMRWLQSGSVHLYLAYVFVTLILLLLFGVRG